MKQTLKLFQMGWRQIVKDGMLLVLLPVPFLAGIVFKLGVPIANKLLEERLSFSLFPWYGLVDGMLLCLTPMLVAMIFAFLLLDERSDGLCAFYQITPVGNGYYLAARIGIPMVWAFCITLLITAVFHISQVTIGVILSSAAVSTLTGTALAMMVVSIAENRVEGLAVSKLMALSFLGLVLVWFVPAPYSYLCSFLPSFWIGKLVKDGVTLGALCLGLLTSGMWIVLFSKRFLARVG